MTAPSFRNWQSVQDEVLRRIHAREWKPGDLIPNEADLAIEFGCARTTVSRALRSLAQNGVLDRKRRAGTRVAAQPVAKATLDIAIIRNDITDRGQKYGYQLLQSRTIVPPPAISGAMKTGAGQPLLHVMALHLADDAPYALENRWINTAVVPQALDVKFDTSSPNEWLLQNVPYTNGEIAFSAKMASRDEADVLACLSQSALFKMDRLTWDNGQSVTKVQILFAPGYQMRTEL